MQQIGNSYTFPYSKKISLIEKLIFVIKQGETLEEKNQYPDTR